MVLQLPLILYSLLVPFHRRYPKWVAVFLTKVFLLSPCHSELQGILVLSIQSLEDFDLGEGPQIPTYIRSTYINYSSLISLDYSFYFLDFSSVLGGDVCKFVLQQEFYPASYASQ